LRFTKIYIICSKTVILRVFNYSTLEFDLGVAIENLWKTVLTKLHIAAAFKLSLVAKGKCKSFQIHSTISYLKYEIKN